VVGAAFLVPAVRWPVIGWARGEAFYQGMPTSYWRSEIQNRYERRTIMIISDKCGYESSYWERQPSAWEAWFDKTLARSPSAETLSAVLIKSEEEAIPVLKELFVSDDIKVRRFAAEKLFRLGDPSLHEPAKSEDENVRRAAIAAWKFAPW